MLRAGAASRRDCVPRMKIAAAHADDLPAIRGLLAANGLPGEDLTSAHLGSFHVGHDAGTGALRMPANAHRARSDPRYGRRNLPAGSVVRLPAERRSRTGLISRRH